MTTQDEWAQWLLQRRHGGDEAYQKQVLEYLYPIRDKVLQNALLKSNETLLDVGCGDGLISFGALDKLPDGKVIFSDISDDLLTHVRALAEKIGAINRCDFVQAAADNLSAIPDESVDAVTTRSVLMYVQHKQEAFKEFYRVLKPGGHFSIFEPINRFSMTSNEGNLLWGFDVTSIPVLADKVRAVYDAIQPPDDPMLNFDERDLVTMAEVAGFSSIAMELQVNISQPNMQGMNWETFIQVAPNPRVPNLNEAMKQALSPAEIEQFTAHIRPLIDAGKAVSRQALAYVWAQK